MLIQRPEVSGWARQRYKMLKLRQAGQDDMFSRRGLRFESPKPIADETGDKIARLIFKAKLRKQILG